MLVTFGTQNVQSNKNWKIFKIVSVIVFLVLECRSLAVCYELFSVFVLVYS